MSWVAWQARWRCCLTSIKVWIESGFKLALQNEIVSLPPEKIHLTATAEPKLTVMILTNLNILASISNIPGIEGMSQAKQDTLWNGEWHLAHHCSRSQIPKSSCGSKKNSSNSFTVALGHCLYQAVKLTFWGDVEEVDGDATGCCQAGGGVSHAYCLW